MDTELNRNVARLLESMVAQGHERAIQAAAWHRGRLVVDAWAGVDEERGGKPIDGESLFPIFSTSKGLASTVVNRLIERGALDAEKPVSIYWPEFAAHGKGGITLGQALSHLSAIPQMPDGVRAEDAADWDGMCRRIADLEPLWEPGTKTAYHAISWSWAACEAACRVTGKPFGRLFQEEVCAPLGLESLYLGLPPECDHRVLKLDCFPPQPPPPGSPAPVPDPVGERAIPAAVKPLEAFMNRTDIRRACIPASNGIGNARGIARHYAALMGEGVDGVRLLRRESVAKATTLRAPPGIHWDALPLKFGLGYALSGPMENPGEVFGHGGYGGSSGFADASHELAFGLVKNRMGTAPGQEGSSQRVLKLIREALDLR